jgi:hypothetical protein
MANFFLTLTRAFNVNLTANDGEYRSVTWERGENLP